MQLKTETDTCDKITAMLKFGAWASAEVTARDGYICACFTSPDNFTLINFVPDYQGHPQVAIHAYGDRIPLEGQLLHR